MQASRQTQPGEKAFAVAITLFSALAFWQAYRISGLSGLTTAGTFPMLASAAMVLSSVFILQRTFGSEQAGTQDGDPIPAMPVLPLRLLISGALVGLYVAVMPWLGFLLASWAFMSICLIYLWRRGIVISLGLSTLSLAAIYLIFRIGFQVVLPQGTLVRTLF